MYESYISTPEVTVAGYHNTPRKRAVEQMLGELREAGAGGKTGSQAIQKKLFKMTCDTRMLRNAWDDLARRGERAPGPNGRRYCDFQEPDIWSLIGCLSDLMLRGRYDPGPFDLRAVPKDPQDLSRGYRTLTLLNDEDAVVQRAVLQVLQALLDPLFGDHAFGFRPGRDRVHAFAHARKLAESEDRYIWVVEDVKNAFDNIPRNSLLEAIGAYLPSPALMDLIRRIVLFNNHRRGMLQGAPLSAFFLNLYLYHFLIRRWRVSKFSHVPVIQVADDLLLLCQTKAEASQAWEHLHGLLRNAGLTTKHGVEKSIHNLRTGKSANWLGYRVRRGPDGPKAKIARRCWNRLKSHLELAHAKPDSQQRATGIVNGWLDQLGPCFAHENRTRAFGSVGLTA